MVASGWRRRRDWCARGREPARRASGSRSLPGGNLLVTMTDLATRSRYVREFLNSGLTQSAFCAAHRAAGGPSDRTLRAWVAAATRPASFTTEARAIVARAVRDLQDLLRALDVVEAVHAGEAEALDDRAVDVAAAARRLPAAGRAPGPPRGHEQRALPPAESDGTQRILLDNISAAIQAVVAESLPVTPEDVGPAAARPEPFLDPWAAGGGFVRLL